LRPGTNTWAFYTGGDINDGWLVFNDVTRIQFEPSGPLPNDLVNDFSVRQDASTVLGSDYLFERSISSVDSNGKSTEVVVRIHAKRLHLKDPQKPGLEIT